MTYHRYVFAVPEDAVSEVESVLLALERESTDRRPRVRRTAAFLYLIRAHTAEVLATAEALRQSRERSERRPVGARA